MPQPLIEFHNVTVYRNERLALDHLSLAIGTGEHTAILGPNGSGKSTFIKAITRECYPRYSGDGSFVRILGKDRWNIFDLRPLLGIVTNDLVETCTRDYSGRETILSGFFGSVGIWPNHEVTPEMERKADEILAFLELTHLADRNVNEMSSGEAKRVVIGRALIHHPKALILDEPTNSLDIHATRELLGTFRKLAQSGTSIILVTHHLHDIIPEISRVVLLKDGRLFRDGQKQEVLVSGALSELFADGVEVVERGGYYHLW